MREKHSEMQFVEPWFEWKRMRSPGSTKIPKDLERELNAEPKPDGDLIKPIPQLLAVAESAKERIRHDQSKLLLDAQNRMVGMIGEVAMKSDKVSEQMLHLRRRISWLTWGIFFLAIVTVGSMVFSYVQPSHFKFFSKILQVLPAL